jgi:hypothetical protein
MLVTIDVNDFVFPAFAVVKSSYSTGEYHCMIPYLESLYKELGLFAVYIYTDSFLFAWSPITHDL